ncbi:hypothetical protein HYT26_02995 [Candidatus Pacearchaeota archaeon]|nr:hypothetical protein [Candidatus Pacearchaeota archaeon]
MEERCIRCETSGNETRLLDGVYDNQRVKICGICAQIEGIPLIRRPSTEQLKQAEKPYTVNERMRRMAGFKTEKQEKQAKPGSFDEFNKERVRKIRESVKPLNLVDNYNWYIQRMRRARNMTRKQLAESIAESEEAIKMIEQGILPSDAEELIKKLEQFFMIKLVKPDDGYVDESIINQLRQKSIRPRTQRIQQTRQPDMLWAERKTKEVVIDRAIAPMLKIGDLKRIQEKGAKLDKGKKEEFAAEIVQDIIQKDELETSTIDDYEWKGKTFNERRKIAEGKKKEGRRESMDENEIEAEGSIFGSDLDIEEK